ASSPLLFELTRGSETVPAIAHAGKTGWLYVMDRRDGRLLFKSEPFVPLQNLFRRPTPEGIEIAPGAAGGSRWSPMSPGAGSGLPYVAGLHWPMLYQVREIPASADKPAIRYTSLEPSNSPSWGTLSAIDTKNGGKIRWQVKTERPMVGGVLATAGGLVFTGEGTGSFNAYDSATGELLWQARAEAGVNAPPITYQVDGKQYIAVAAGGNSLFGFKQ